MPGTDTYADIVDAPEFSSLHEGQRVFERYVLEEMAGRGSTGPVWKARDKTLDRIVALKFLPERLYRDTATRDALKQDTRWCLELAHPNIVRIYDFLEDGDMAAIAMEYVDGPSLSQLRMEQPSRCFKPEELSGWVTELCAAIDYAHAADRCLYRKLKPGGLMVNFLGFLKIAPFGFGFSSRDHAGARSNHGAALAYMSPQEVIGEAPSPSDDIYTMGATLYELLTGKPPFYGDDLSTQIQEVIPESMAARRRSFGLPECTLPAVWEDTIAACLAKDPHWRPASGSEVASRLGLSAPPPQATSSSEEKSAPIRQWLNDPRLQDALSRVTEQVRTRVAQLKAVPWKEYRWQMIAGAATLCAILSWLDRPKPLSAPPVAAAAHAVTLGPAPAPTSPSPATPPVPATPAAVVTTAAPVAAPTVVVAPPAPAPSPAEAPTPKIVTVPPQTADQRALTEPIPTPEAGAQVRIETVPPGIPFQVTSDSPDAPARTEVQSSGVSPATLTLPKGAYRIVYSLPGQEPRMTSVKVPATGSTLFQQEFPHGVVKVHCQPERAEVICDGRSVGAAPVDLLLPPGHHEIGARWNGKQARTKTIELADAGEQTLAFEFHTSSSSSSSSTRPRQSKKKQDASVFTKIGRGFKNLFDGDSDKKH